MRQYEVTSGGISLPTTGARGPNREPNSPQPGASRQADQCCTVDREASAWGGGAGWGETKLPVSPFGSRWLESVNLFCSDGFKGIRQEAVHPSHPLGPHIPPKQCDCLLKVRERIPTHLGYKGSLITPRTKGPQGE